MSSKRDFYKYTVTVTIASEKPLPADVTLLDIYHSMYGDASMSWNIDHEKIDGPGAAKLLLEQHSDPEFFMLTEDGEDIEDG